MDDGAPIHDLANIRGITKAEKESVKEMEGNVVSTLNLILKRALKSRKATGTRLFILKALVDLGCGWHTTTDVLHRLAIYSEKLPQKVDHIFELALRYPDLIQTDISVGLPLKDTHVKIRDEIYPIIANFIDSYISKLPNAK